MRFGEKLRALRATKRFSLRKLGRELGVSYAYISKVENGKLAFGDYPSTKLIRRMAAVLGADEDELLLLAEKIPELIRRRVMERPEAFRELARLDDRRLDQLLILIRATDRNIRKLQAVSIE